MWHKNFENENVYILNFRSFGKVTMGTHEQAQTSAKYCEACADPFAEVWLPVCCVLRGRCTDAIRWPLRTVCICAVRTHVRRSGYHGNARTSANQRKVLNLLSLWSVRGPICRGLVTSVLRPAWSLYRYDALTSTDCLHLRCADPCAEVWLPVCCVWSLYRMWYTDLCGLVAFARCAARSLYGMRFADLCGLVAFAWCAARSLYRMRCADLYGLIAFAMYTAWLLHWNLALMLLTERFW